MVILPVPPKVHLQKTQDSGGKGNKEQVELLQQIV